MRADVVLTGARVVGPRGARVRALPLGQGRVLRRASPRSAPISLDGHLIFPGLVNAHDHLKLNCLPRPELDGPFPCSALWIEALRPHLTAPAMRQVRAVPAPLRLWQGGLKNLLAGTTTVAHHDPWDEVLEHPDFPVRVVRGLAWSHSLQLAGSYGPSLAEGLAALREGRAWVLHLAEGTDPDSGAELDRLEALGGLRPGTVLVHAVGLPSAAAERAIRRGAAVVWCPSSNLQTLGRTLEPASFQAAGCLALGTDSRVSGSRDMLRELQCARSASRLSPAQLGQLATTAGARILRCPQAGGLAAGQHADLLVIRDAGGDPWEALLGSDRAALRAVVLGGLPAVADPDLGHWFDLQGVETITMRLDGAAKLVARRLLGPPGAVELEPGLDKHDQDEGTA